ncbi:MAG TPA: AbrB/MazE/SpoVT family DNA-binding domain-containing protein [Pseudorhizobium sp.]|nr:AbrB/MazE/SpoVT family DNA-binding domain-containing protein [Pseudorhizobium sp.]
MDIKVQITSIGDEKVVAIPQEALDSLGWSEGTKLCLRFDHTGIDIFRPPENDEDDFHRQLLIARKAMRKYHVALRELGKT